MTLLFLLLFAGSATAQTHQDWSYNLGIYEVNVRQYTEEGTFTAFRTHLQRLEAMNVGILWFMPINPIGQQNRIGSLGSYYSVQDYYGINPEFGDMEDFKAVVNDAHSRGMYVIIDWVANHTSWDNVLTESHPEWYVKDNQGNFIPPPGTNWSDVIELDYSKQGLRDYMIDALKFWVDSAGVDGFRFDAVSFVPDDFWTEALSALKAHKPDIFLLAEGDDPKLTSLGFDMSFGWGLYGFESGVFHDIANGGGNSNSLNSYAEDETKKNYPNGEYRMYFTSNHDINSWEGTTYTLFGAAADVFAVLTATLNGMPLIYSGQEAGLDKQLQFFEKDEIEWKLDDNLQMYTTLLELKKRNKALWNGNPENYFRRFLSSNNTSIFAFRRSFEGDTILVLTNLSDQEKTFTLWGSSWTGNYKNVFTDEDVTLTEDSEFTLPAWGYLVYEGDGTQVGIEEGQTPSGFRLDQNYPNPFNPSTVISYQLAVNSMVQLKVFDTLGREVAALVDGFKSAGKHTIEFKGDNIPSGVYIYKLDTEHTSLTKSMTLIK